MLLHQATYALNLGTKAQPIHIDCPLDEWNPDSSQPPASSVASTSLSLPQRPLTTHIPLNSKVKPRTTSRETGRATIPPFITSSMRKESLVAEPMTAHSQDVVQLLKRKRGDVEEETVPELAKKVRKSEKKRRKKERRAARVAQLGTNISALHSPPIRLNIDLLPGARSPESLQRGPLVQNIPLPTHMPQPGNSTPIMSPRGPHRHQSQKETMVGQETVGLNQQHTHPPSNSQMVLTPSVAIPSLHVLSSSRINEDPPFNSPQGKPLRVSQVANVIDTPTSHSDRTSSSVLNRRIKERMALLIEHQRLMNGTDSLPSAPVPRKPNTGTSQIVTGDTIATKQNALDRAISENKAALAQLGAPLNKEQKLILMKAVIERNKLITQLTNEIKTQLDSLRTSVVTAPSPPDNLGMRFKWPETEFPLFLIIADDDEDVSQV